MRIALVPPVAVVAAVAFGGAAVAKTPFVHWETAHVSPLAVTPDGDTLLACNTPDNHLEIFDLSSGTPVHLASVPVGLDPVSVRARTDDEAWVVNQISDSISVVDLVARKVVRTILTADEPADVVFAGTVVERAFVSCSQPNLVQVFDPAAPAAPPVVVEIAGEEPRMLARSADGSQVYAAIFESGNATTILGGGSLMGNPKPPNVVSSPKSPYATGGAPGPNPPPNAGTTFSPPIDPSLPPPPAVGLVVRKDSSGNWMDDNAHDWTHLVTGNDAADSGRIVGWDMPDRDLAVLDADNPSTASTTYATRMMNVCMAIAVHPTSGFVSMVGIDGDNEVRFEPNLNGRFVQVYGAYADPAGPSTVGRVDLNPHIVYSGPFFTTQAEKDESIGDPRGIVWTSDGLLGFVTGMGSNNVVVVDGGGARVGQPFPVSAGPTGIVLDEGRNQLYVLCKFASTVDVVSLPGGAVTSVPMHDPSPPAIKDGRRMLYDTHLSSGFGQVACASCHVDSRMDRLAWDLGDPTGAMKAPDDQSLGGGNIGLSLGHEAWHPMKGPMTTQTLQHIVGMEPFHWRGDRDGLEEFSPAFTGLLGDDAEPSARDMQDFEDFLATIHFPPSPYRGLDNGLPTALVPKEHFASGDFALPEGAVLPAGDATVGLSDYSVQGLDGAFACVNCHTLPTGKGGDMHWNGTSYEELPLGPLGEFHTFLNSTDAATNVSLAVPQLRNLDDKAGFHLTQLESNAGFGYIHDGSIDSLSRFLTEGVFNFASDQQLSDMIALMLAFPGSELPGSNGTSLFDPPGPESRDTHAGVGQQVTFVTTLALSPPADVQRIAAFLAEADTGRVGLVGKGVFNGAPYGVQYLGAQQWALDVAPVVLTSMQLSNLVGPGNECTFTLVPKGTERRIGIDRDGDGCLDGDEIAGATDPADPTDCTCSDPLPAAPTGLAAAPRGLYELELTWTDGATNETAYAIERRTGGGPYARVATLPPDTTLHRDGGLLAGTTYDYRVSAVGCAGASPATITAATNSDANLPTMHVYLIQMTKDCDPTNSRVRALVDVYITETVGAPIALDGAVVEGSFSNAVTKTGLYGQTASVGGALYRTSFASPWVDLSTVPNPTFTFTVDSVTKMEWVYDASLDIGNPTTQSFTCP